MKLRIVWPGKTRNQAIKSLQDFYLRKINRLEKCEIIETKEAKGIAEKFDKRIRKIEGEALEKYLDDGYIICLSDRGQEMSSPEFARFLEKISSGSPSFITFITGGFLGLEEKILRKANFLLALSKMTFSHELIRLALLEQIYRSLTIRKGIKYAK
ncbi:MAG: 23S rRNA (pseudouridine(1915)-N(3))-methyltransferase RlmH [Candidatus Aminicenantales bacterium]